MKFSVKPAAVVISLGNVLDEEFPQDIAWIGDVTYGRAIGQESPYYVEISSGNDTKVIGLADIVSETQTEIVARSHPNNRLVTVRAVEPSDAMICPGLNTRIPLPPEVITASLSQYGAPVDTTLHALADDDGFVSTMMLIAPTGIYVRYDGSWVSLQNPDVIDGLDVFEVEDEALSVYDDADAVNRTMHVSSMPIAEEDRYRAPEVAVVATAASETPPPLPNEEPEPGPASEPGSSDALVLPAQVDEVITAAAADPSLQWFAEKRARAHGYSGSFPWD